MGSGKPLGDGIYWPTNQPDERASQSSPATNKRTSMSPQKQQYNNSQTPGSNLYKSSKFPFHFNRNHSWGLELDKLSKSVWQLEQLGIIVNYPSSV